MRFGPTIVNVLTSADSTTIAVASTAVIYTRAFNLKRGEYFALCYKATSDGTVGLLIQLEQSWVLPATEGSQDNNWVIPENMADIEADLADETQHHKVLNPLTLPYGRLKITGSGANHSSTVLRMRLAKQEE